MADKASDIQWEVIFVRALESLDRSHLTPEAGSYIPAPETAWGLTSFGRDSLERTASGGRPAEDVRLTRWVTASPVDNRS